MGTLAFGLRADDPPVFSDALEAVAALATFHHRAVSNLGAEPSPAANGVGLGANLACAVAGEPLAPGPVRTVYHCGLTELN